MDRAGPLLSMLATTMLVAGGAVLGYLSPGEGSRITAAFVYAIGGLMVAAYLRVIVFHVLLPVWCRVTFTTQAGWMALQIGFTVLGIWIGWDADLPADMSRPTFMLLETVMGGCIGLAVTALWAWSYDLFATASRAWFSDDCRRYAAASAFDCAEPFGAFEIRANHSAASGRVSMRAKASVFRPYFHPS